MKVWEMPHVLGDRVHNVWVLPRGLGGSGHTLWVLPHGLGGPVDLTAKSMRALQAFGPDFGALGGRGGEQSIGNWTLRFRSYGYMAKELSMAKI
jgi:hypothetical protein